MSIIQIDSNSLLLEKAPPPLKESDIEELKRIEKLDVTGFIEEDVRAEIIETILRILGYRKGEDFSVDRGKHIRFLGKSSRFIDFNMTLWNKNFWLIEAKRPLPQKAEFDYEELSQALQYALHPQIEAALVVLCDGVKLEVFDREQDLEKPLLRLSINTISEKFVELQKLLSPINIWFFYKRRVIRAIDRAFEHEINQSRVNEFRQIVDNRLNEKRSLILKNFQKMKLSEQNTYTEHLKKASVDEIIDIHFFYPQTLPDMNVMFENLVSVCKERSSFV